MAPQAATRETEQLLAGIRAGRGVRRRRRQLQVRWSSRHRLGGCFPLPARGSLVPGAGASGGCLHALKHGFETVALTLQLPPTPAFPTNSQAPQPHRTRRPMSSVVEPGAGAPLTPQEPLGAFVPKFGPKSPPPSSTQLTKHAPPRCPQHPCAAGAVVTRRMTPRKPCRRPWRLQSTSGTFPSLMRLAIRLVASQAASHAH